jgi:deazaflavin-dependent oxidoreductase (nitroreductase family)
VSKTYRLGASQRVVNAVIGSLTRFGLAGRHTYILTVRGRKTGRAYSTPVRLIEDGERWLVAPYGEVGWVCNARAAGKVEIRRAGRSETLSIEEVASDQSDLFCSSTSSACRWSVPSSTSHRTRRSTIT